MKNITQQSYAFHVNGMHCKACVALIEDELSEMPEITKAKASLHRHRVEIAGNFGDKTQEEIATQLSNAVTAHGYTVTVDKHQTQINWREFNVAIPIAGALIALFILLQKLEIVNLINSSEATLGTAFVIGLIASVSTCMAVVGGLVLSMSANFAKEGDRIRPQLLFHVGRLIAFFILGGVIGAIGASFQLGITGTFVMSFLIGLIMILLGINLIDVFPWAKKLQPTLPVFISSNVQQLKKVNHLFTPLLVGVVTFFLPCGFTQSMQIYTLTTGGFIEGALTMFAFALGTLPVLALLSFSTSTIHKKAQSGIFFKTAGLVVVFFGLFNIYNSFVAVGILSSLFSF